jgi:hypothetical protein
MTQIQGSTCDVHMFEQDRLVQGISNEDEEEK